MAAEPKLLILDLDETLIHALEAPLARPADFEFHGIHVYLRPHVRQFIDFCAAHFRLAVWTSASPSYARQIVEYLFGHGVSLEFVWARDRCTRVFDPELHDFEWTKNLAKVKRRGYKLEQVIMVDDTPAKLARHYGNLVCIKAFEGDTGDRELLLLMAYLAELKLVENVRVVEKRHWRLRHAAAHQTSA